jgi:hypothetical protein
MEKGGHLEFSQRGTIITGNFFREIPDDLKRKNAGSYNNPGFKYGLGYA